MSAQPRPTHREDGEQLRELLEARVRQLFGDERAEAVSAEIDRAAAAIERVRRLRPPDFVGLDPEERG